eukprot:COSAG04_NODE_841_length_9946_cov_6.344775_9_plen_161_part_00
MDAPPTFEEMLVGGSRASAMLASLFTVEQQPSLVFPLTIEPTHDPALDNGGGHRRTQANGGGSGAQDANSVVVTVKVEASTAAEADDALQVVVESSGGVTLGRRLEQATVRCDSELLTAKDELLAARAALARKDAELAQQAAIVAQQAVVIAELKAQLKA